MKKSFLLGIAAAMMLGLTGCNKSSAPSGPATPELPEEAGKVTFYFELEEGSVELPDYLAYYCTGTFNEWAEPYAEDGSKCVLMQNLEGTNYYYGVYNVDGTTITENGYQLTMGYTVASGAGAGIKWGGKSTYCATFPGVEHPVYELNEAKTIAYLGKHKWDAALPAPVKISNIEISVTLKDAAPEWVQFTMRGDVNNWGNDEGANISMTSTDRKTWKYTITNEILAGEHEIQMLMNYVDEDPTWDHKLLGDKSNNYKIALSKLNETDGYNYNEENLDLLGQPLEVEYLPDPDAVEPIALKFVLVADAAITETLEVTGAWNNNWGTPVAMTTTDHVTFTFEAATGFNSNTNYGAFAVKGATGGSDWHKKIQPDTLFKTLAGDSLVTVTLKAGGAAYFNAAYAENEWDGLSEDLYEVTVEPLVLAA